MHVEIDRIRRRLERTARFTATPDAGATRLTYSPEYRQACDYLLAEAKALGLQARLDAIGNLRIRLQGSDASAAPVVVASHVDTVRHGGDFDGVLGVVCGLEALEVLVRNEVRPRRPIELISFAEEEGTTFACPMAGSKLLTGVLDADDLHRLRSATGDSLYRQAGGFGLEPDRLHEDRLHAGAVKAMLELHIEQAPVLEAQGIPVGIVGAIAGSEVHRLTVGGTANHAGTTPIDRRRDALAAAAEIVLAAERTAAESGRPTAVATVGQIQCSPNAPNVIPGRVELTLDVRDVRADDIRAMAGAIIDSARAIATARDVTFASECTGASDPQPLSSTLAERLGELAKARGIACRRMHSGALHDVAAMATITEAALLFVPSRDGRSHTPEEWTDWADIEPGANLLLVALHDLAAQAD